MRAQFACGVLLGLGGAMFVWLSIDVKSWPVFLFGWAVYCAGLVAAAIPVLEWLWGER